MYKQEAQQKFENNEVITPEIGKLLNIHSDYWGATKEEVEVWLDVEREKK